MARLSRVLLAATLATMAATCGSPVAPSGQPVSQSPLQGALTVASLDIAGRTFFVLAGQTSQLTATAKMSDGTSQDVGAKAAWQSSDTAVATVSATGVVTANGFGAANISAVYQGVTGRSAVSVARTGPPIVDQQFSLPNSSDAYGGGLLAGQSFTVGRTGVLAGADLTLWTYSSYVPTDVLVQVFATSAGLPTGTPLTGGTISGTRLPVITGGKAPSTHVDFNPVVPVNSGEVFALAFSWPDVVTNGVHPGTESVSVRPNEQALYGGGQALLFRSSNSTSLPQGWHPYAQEFAFAGTLDADFEFRTYVGPVTP